MNEGRERRGEERERGEGAEGYEEGERQREEEYLDQVV